MYHLRRDLSDPMSRTNTLDLGAWRYGVEFDTKQSRRLMEDDDDEASGVASPPLWENQSQSQLSPASRLQAIVKGRKEMMEMVKNMPEPSYELSLKDLVEMHRPVGSRLTSPVRESELPEEPLKSVKKVKRKDKEKNKKKQMARSESMENGVFLLKMFFPVSLGGAKKRSSNMGIGSRVSPTRLEGEKGGEQREWWKRSGSGGTSSRGSSNSSSGRGRKMGDFVPGCWSFFHTRRSKAKGQ
ncbi:hypothetical protein QJS10_CPB13g01001 [Acorus calamus]|uniref:Uncharacterized protein n=1 Tax=Acorus calamus TaxID=4465 RepID=A0AAV9DI70_ACOCL|nr:hypothetical protein QJS10_CPB13g01001 [Acorus calamus]